MIIKVNAVLKVRVPDTEKFEGKGPLDIVEGVRQMMNKDVFPVVAKDTGLVLSLRMSMKDLRVAP